METTINTQNAIIAEFMGLVKSSVPKIWWTKKSAEGFGEGQMVELIYHKDWNWLMEVVEKIKPLSRNGNHHYKLLMNMPLEMALQKEVVYNACIEFIKWYNEQKL